MRQRATIALALLFRPRLPVADAPTTGLDVPVQRQVLDLLRRTRAETGIALIFASHDLALIGGLCDRVAVMLEGSVVEEGPPLRLLAAPGHPYTRARIAAVPVPDPAARKEAP